MSCRMKSMKLTIGSPIIKLTFRMMSIAPDPKQEIASNLYPLVTTVLKLLSVLAALWTFDSTTLNILSLDSRISLVLTDDSNLNFQNIVKPKNMM